MRASSMAATASRRARKLALITALVAAWDAASPASARAGEPMSSDAGEPMSLDAGEPASAEPGPGRPQVHLEVRGRLPLTLYEVQPAAEPEAATLRRAAPGVDRAICTAPCDRIVDGRQGQSFVLGGPGIARSIPFTLLQADTALTIRARPGRNALRIAGWVLAAVGAGAALAGAATLTAADDDRDLRRAGAFTFVAGLPVLTAGILMVAFGRTRFRLGDAPRPRR